MKSLSNFTIALIVVTTICSASIGIIAGSHFGRTNSTPEPTTLHLVDPNYFAAPPQRAIVSPGGFTGFGLQAFPGEVIASGTLVAAAQDGNGGGTLVFHEGGRETLIRYRNGPKIRRIVTGANLFTGATVLLRLEGGTTVSMLHIPFDHSHRSSESP